MIQFSDIVSMLGGLALFLYGMHMLSASLEKISGNKLSGILEKLAGSTWKSVLLGAGVTALVQSSGATTVIAVGLVNSGILKLGQAIGIIMGSNIGTTVTAHILRLTDVGGGSFFMSLLNPSTFAPIMALCGAALVMFSKKSRPRVIGEVMAAFGILFIGMLTMEESLSGLKDSPVLANLFRTLGGNAVLGILVGAGVTALLQSSSASVGILQAISSTGALSWAAAVPIILGQNIGSTVTSMISVIGASKNAKRTAISHLYFNVIGTILFTVGILIIRSLGVFDFWEDAIDKSGIANFHTIFNVTMTVLFMPFIHLLEKLCVLTVPSDGTEIDSDTSALDERLFVTPALAEKSAATILEKIGALTETALGHALERLNGDTKTSSDRVHEEVNAIGKMENALQSYLQKLSEQDLLDEEARAVTGLMTRAQDCFRIADHALRISDTAEDLSAKGKGLTMAGKREFALLSAAARELLRLSVTGSAADDKRASAGIEPLYAVINEMTETIQSRHTERLKSGECSYEAGSLFVGTLIDIERITKHCSNMGVSLALQHKTNSLSDDEFARRIHRGDTEHFVEKYIQCKTDYYAPLMNE